MKNKLRNIYQKVIYRLLRYRNLNFNNRLSTNNAVASKLQSVGIAMLSWQELFGESPLDSPLYLALEAEAVSKLKGSSNNSTPRELKSSYLRKAYKVGEKIDTLSPLIQLTAHPVIKDIAKNFFGGAYRLMAADYWLSFASVNASRTASQMWHTDPEDTIMFKLFVYFTDVDESSGATEFIPGSQIGGVPELRLFEVNGTSGRYYIDDEITQIIKRAGGISIASGKRGSCIFINTTGIHRGGYGQSERLMANYTFVSNLCPLKTRWNN